MRIRRSTLGLIVAWIAVFALYLEVRPAPQPVPTSVPVQPVAPTTTRP